MTNAARRNITVSEVELDRKNVIGRSRKAIIFGGTFGGSIQVAIKRVMTSDLHSYWEKRTLDECFNKLAALDHPNVVKMIGIYDDDNFRYHVMDLCIASVFDYCCNTYKGEVPSQADGLFQMISGLHYIHSQGFIHRSIKPENALISLSIQIKISDFGLTMPISASASFSMSSSQKTSLEMQAPEILQSDDEDSSVEKSDARHNVASDTFSLGCLLYSFLTKGDHPFLSGGSRHFVALNIIEGKYNLASLGEQHFAVAIIENMIKREPHERMKLDEALTLLKPHISRA
ncbi:serine/threonine-protein kinase/endoribonuclease ire-1-like [Daphnia carinata]|uniref:serine/threonine-protein kinase/endoribonuclease ire-1-like n=1 Tax=Daphnia carinata TaxID=120202 RepID=UPI00257F1268|nr:serine/threonine-protein kinase/endoribonuclease ire-1-like [Daphnia carinata]